MGQPAARRNDICTGHGCWPPRPNISASSNVFINSRGAHRLGDAWRKHCCPHLGCHSGVTATGSSSVFVNGRPAARVEDMVSCGSAIMTGSHNVFIGD